LLVINLGLQQQLERLLQACSCLAGLCYCLQGTQQCSFACAAQQHIWHSSSTAHSPCSGMLLLCAASLLLLPLLLLPLLLPQCVLRCGVLTEPQAQRTRQFARLCAVGDPDFMQLQVVPRHPWFVLLEPQLPLGVSLLLCLHNPSTWLFWLLVEFVLLPRLLSMPGLQQLLLLLACSWPLLGVLRRPRALWLKHWVLLQMLLLLVFVLCPLLL
jgi:hypothetical protein